MKGRINRQNPRPQTNEAMRAAILAEWQAIDHEDLYSLLLTMADRVAAVRAAQGGHTRF